MPRKKGIKPAIGNTMAEGLPVDHTPYSKRGVDRARVSISSAVYSGVTASCFDGSQLVTFPTYEPLFIKRSKVIQYGFALLRPATCATVQAGGTIPSISTQMETVFENTFDLMLDNIAMKYANAQNLAISTPSEWEVYIIEWLTAATIYAFFVSLLNGDGFNEVTTRIAQAGISFRSRIQTGYDRLQSVPAPPGLWDIILRSVGYFASYDGGDCYLGYPALGGNIVLDFSTASNWTGPLTLAEDALAFLQGSSSSDAGIIRIVASEYYGPPRPVPYPGVRVCKALYDQFRLISMRSLGATNVFGAPAVVQTTETTSSGQLVPLLIPKGSENDPWWSALYRLHPYELANNVPLINGGTYGIFGDDGSVASGVLGYLQGNSGLNPDVLVDTGLNGFASPFNENYWAPLAAGTTGGFDQDQRSQNSFSVFNVSIDQLASNTMNLMRRIYVSKEQIGYPPDCRDVSALKVRPRL